MRTLIVDDSQLLLANLRCFLEDCSEVTVVGAANSGAQAIDLVRLQHPELVLLDLHMPGMNGFEAASRIMQEFPSTCVVHISTYGGREYERASQQSGAQCLLSKSKLVAEFPDLLRRLSGALRPSTVNQPSRAYA